jgi:hypothetical protein
MQGYHNNQRKLTLPERLDNIERQQQLILQSINVMRKENHVYSTLTLSLIQKLINDRKIPELPKFIPNIEN